MTDNANPYGSTDLDMMDTLCIGLAMPLVLMALETGEPPSGWKKLAPPGGRFEAAVPADPVASKRKVATASGHLLVHVWMARGKDESAFVVSYFDLSEDELAKGPIETRLDHARDGAVSSARGKLQSEKRIELAGHPGRDLAIEKDGKRIARVRLVLVGRRLFQVMALGASDKDAAILIDSFRPRKP